MDLNSFVISIMLTVAILAPIAAMCAVSLIRKGKYRKHIRIQKTIFWICMVAVLLFEIYIRISGGSGSLIKESIYTDTKFFRLILNAHIAGAVFTYLLWIVMIIISNRKYKMAKKLPGKFSKTHKALGYLTIFGLFYTAISALIVCVFAFLL